MQSRDTARRKEKRRLAKMRATADGGKGAGKGAPAKALAKARPANARLA